MSEMNQTTWLSTQEKSADFDPGETGRREETRKVSQPN
jgi:hypothetical protein